jgi:hypothetical protein
MQSMARFTIDFSPQAERELRDIQKALDAGTKADVIRKALSLVKYVVEERQHGGRIFVENEKEKVRKEIVTL